MNIEQIENRLIALEEENEELTEENEELMEKKATDILNYVAPVPYTRPLKKALTKGAADLVD